MSTSYLLTGLGVMALVTGLIRLIPFLIFSGNKATPPYIIYMGRILPPAIMSMLVVYCYKSIQFSPPFYIPSEIIAGIAVILLHIWKRNSLLSIGAGTVLNIVLKICFGI